MRKIIDAVLLPVLGALIISLISFSYSQLARFNQLLTRVEAIEHEIDDLRNHNVAQYNLDRDRVQRLSHLEGLVELSLRLRDCEAQSE